TTTWGLTDINSCHCSCSCLNSTFRVELERSSEDHQKTIREGQERKSLPHHALSLLTQAHEMPAVHLEIFGMAGRVLRVDLLKCFEERLQIVREPVPQGPTLLGFRQVVHDHDRTGTCLRFGARAIIGLAIGQQATTALRDSIER